MHTPNGNKKEIVLVTSNTTEHLHSPRTSITNGNAQYLILAVCEEFLVTSKYHLSMNSNLSNIVRTCYYELRRLASISTFPTTIATATFVFAFDSSRIHYCS